MNKNYYNIYNILYSKINKNFLMYTDPVAELLRPKQSNLIKSCDSVGSYRPKSIQSNRSNKNIIAS